MLDFSHIVSGDVIDNEGNKGVALYRAPQWWIENRDHGLEITELEALRLDMELFTLTPLDVKMQS